MPRSRTYIGPPAIEPFGVVTRYLMASTASAYFVAIPKTPVSQIQRTAPGPPAATAVATPTMFPVPIVAASAVVSAPKWLTSPSPSRSRCSESRMPSHEVALDEAQPERQVEVGAEEQDEQGRPPHEIARLREQLLHLRHHPPPPDGLGRFSTPTHSD